jgi:uncharacterized hydrophobic protein (TIGR00271 family)
VAAADQMTESIGGRERGAEPPEQTALGTLTHWFREHLGTPPDEEAIQAVEELIPEGDEFWPFLRGFAVLIVLSAGIAAFGLLADSGAVVIGAMLVAPLMTPITAAAASTVTARNRRLGISLIVIAFGTTLAIAVGWTISAIAGTSVTGPSDLPNEVISRTFPGLLDLGIAITAGAAAGYIAPRRSVTSALPGVGIAVALVPPLATVGITFHLGLGEQARNAMLLYLTNLAAIVFAASVMLLLAGFRPESGTSRRSLSARLAVTVIAVALVAIPLSLHTRTTVRDAALRSSVSQAILGWDDSVRVIELDASVDGGLARVELLVSGPNNPRQAWELAEAIERRFGGPVDLRLLYQQDQLFTVSVR